MLRWGVTSLLVLGRWRLMARGGRQPPAIVVMAGAAGAALLFAAAHLPALAAAGEPPGVGAMLRTLLANAMAGLLFGWLLARRDLLAAMLAHGGAHLGFAAASWSCASRPEPGRPTIAQVPTRGLATSDGCFSQGRCRWSEGDTCRRIE